MRNFRNLLIGIFFCFDLLATLPQLDAQPLDTSVKDILTPSGFGAWTTATNWPAMLQLIESFPTLSASGTSAAGGTFWSAQNPGNPPLPADLNNLPVWNLGNDVYFLEDLNFDYYAAFRPPTLLTKRTRQSLPSLPGGGSPVQIVISNYSFEYPSTTTYTEPMAGWTITGSTDDGVLNSAYFTGTIAPAPDGSQSGFINGWGTYTTVSQVLSNDLQADMTYTLSIAVTGRLDGYNPGTNYSVSLYAGGNWLASVTPMAPPVGSWTNLQVSYSTGSYVPSDQYLQIVIGTAATELDFDNVQLSELPGSVTTNAGQMLSITNYSFESPSTTTYTGSIDGWTLSLSGSQQAGTLNTGYFSGILSAAPDGSQAGYINGWGSLAEVSQTLTNTLQPDSTYTLSIEVTGRSDGYSPGTDYSVSLYAGGTLLTSVTPVTPPVGSWTTLIATYTSGDSVSSGQNLAIVMATPETELDFDNVQLNVSPVVAMPQGVPTPTYTYSTNYLDYTNFWLTISSTNTNTQAVVAIQNTQSNLTYAIYTNSVLDPHLTNWGLWQICLASNAVTVAPAISLGGKDMFFAASLVLITGTNQIADWWQMLYFGHLNVDPNGDSMQDDLSNLQKYQMGLNPNTSYLSQLMIEPPGGTNIAVPQITIFSLTNGSTIRYTTNGSTPSATNGFTTTSGIALANVPTGSFTLKAWESGLVSLPATATFTVVAGAPTFSLPSGLYTNGTTVQVSSLPATAIVRYTIDGSVPTTNSPSIQPTNFITLTNTETINATAWYNGVPGPISSASYEISNAPPNDNFTNALVLTGASGEFKGTTLGSTLESFETYALLDFYANNLDSVWYQWTAPSNGTVVFDYSHCVNLTNLDFSIYYSASNTLNPTNLIEADFSTNDSLSTSLNATGSVSYYIRVGDWQGQGPIDIYWQYYGPAPTPIFSPDAGTYTNSQLVSVFCNDPNAIVYYTTDGTAPTTTNLMYSPGLPIFVSTNITLKAAAWRTGFAESAVYSATYSINPSATNSTLTVATPSLSPANTNFASSLVVTLTCTNPGATIHYNLTGNIPSPSDPSVSSGGTVTITNTALFNAKAWVSNMNASAVAAAEYAKQNTDSDYDGIPDTAELQIGSNPFLSDGGAVNPNPFAHGLDNLQVYQNPSVLLANNYSTDADGVPDWWKIANGYNVNTSATLVGGNGQTLLFDYTDNLSPNNPGDQPAAISQIDFHAVAGQSNNVILVLDRVVPSVIGCVLRYTDLNLSSPTYNQTFQKWIPTNTALAVPGQSIGRFYPLPNPQLVAGQWGFQLFGVDALGNWSKPSTCYSAQYSQYVLSGPGGESTSYALFTNSPVNVFGYTNDTLIKDSVLIQELRASSALWQDLNGFSYGVSIEAIPPWILNGAGYQPVASSNYWGVGQFDSTLHYVGDSVHFTAFCTTGDSLAGCYSGTPTASYGPLIIDYTNSTPADLRMQSATNYLFNQFGLECLSVEVSVNGGTPVVLYPGDTMAPPPSGENIEVAQNLETPTLQTVGYCFDNRVGPMYGAGWLYSFPPVGGASGFPDWNADSSSYYPVCQTNPVIVAQVGKAVTLESYRSVMAHRPNGQAIPNQSVMGYDQYYNPIISPTYWIEQQLNQAYLCDPTTGDVPRTSATNYNGSYKINTNTAVTTGIIAPDYPSGNVASPSYYSYQYERRGQFTPTQPGKVIITTMPDANGNYGEVVVYVIDMQVDANHDGVMDNRDLTSLDNPMQFWVNNDVDRWHTIDFGTDSEQDDLQISDSSIAQYNQVPDCFYGRTLPGTGTIPCTRDLEDYARLWIPGLSNLMQVLPTNYSVTLQWRNNTGAGIRAFAAADADGGTNYLFDTTIASNQINYLQYPCLGYADPTHSISMNSAFSYPYAPSSSDHFIFCGTASGNDELVLAVNNQFGGEVGEASVFVNLKDIKQMYERWSVGEDPTQLPNNIATNCGDQGVASFTYPYDAAVDSTTAYILHVHGSNMETWEKDRFAETMYKRLYWQGYQGRFGSFRWPTASGFNPLLLNTAGFFGGIEFRAWQSATGLDNLLTRLNILYPGQVQISAHSMGNVLVGEALREATSTLVQTYTAFQGNPPAHTYDTNAPTLSLGSYDVGESNVYAHYWNATNDQYFSAAIGAARYVNFFNTNDFVLNAWLGYQHTKPVSTMGYGYISGQYYQGIGSGPTIMTFPTNTYQIFAFCQQAKCNCIGERVGLGGVFATDSEVDLLAAPYSFGTAHKGHSAEFRSDNMSRAVFWDQVLIEMNLKR